VTIREGDSALVIGYGPVLLSEAWKAAEQMTKLNIELVNLPWLNEVDPVWLREIVGRHRHVFTLDNHYLAGGQGQLIAAKLSELGLPHAPTVVRIGVEGIPACGQNAEVLRAHRLDADGIAARILEAHSSSA
jgi:transketolase